MRKRIRRKQIRRKQIRRKRVWLEMLAFTAIMAGICYLFRLNRISGVIVWGIGIVLMPVFDFSLQRSEKAKTEYYEMTAYMEQILCSYKRLGNIRLALEDCITLFTKDSEMGKALRQALHTLKTGEGVEGKEIVKGALTCIDKRYSSRRMLLLHEFLCSVEKMGGDTAEALDILLSDLQMWKRRTAVYQKRKQFIRAESSLAILLAGAMCYISRLLIPYDFLPDLTTSLFYQISTAFVLSCLICMEILILYKLTGSWLDVREAKAEKLCRREIEKEFPYWLLSVTLYLQHDSVFHAVKRSEGQTQGVFRDEVHRFLERIYEEPSSLLPYTEFFCQLRLPEIQTGMKILYSVNANGYQETRKQVRFLVEQNNMVMDKCECNRFENRLAGLGLLKQVPMLIACIKVVADMVAFMMMTMGNYLQMLG